jgi:hypothetical protein
VEAAFDTLSLEAREAAVEAVRAGPVLPPRLV